MNRATGADAYRRIEADSRSPLELVVMLYDGALRFLGEARQASVRRDLRGRAAGISKALAIVGELQSTLNLAAGGSVAEEMDRLYTYLTQRLVDATGRREDAARAEVQSLLTPVRTGWIEAAGGRP